MQCIVFTVLTVIVHNLQMYNEINPDEIKDKYYSGSFYIIRTIILRIVVQSYSSLFSIFVVTADSPNNVTVQVHPGLDVKENVLLTLREEKQ